MNKMFSAVIFALSTLHYFAAPDAHADARRGDAPAQSAGVASDSAFEQFFHQCFIPPKEATGNRFTFHFAIKKDGSLIGKPSVFWLTLEDEPTRRAALEPLLVKALQKCFPVPLVAPFKDMVPGRVHILEFDLDHSLMEIQD